VEARHLVALLPDEELPTAHPHPSEMRAWMESSGGWDGKGVLEAVEQRRMKQSEYQRRWYWKRVTDPS